MASPVGLTGSGSKLFKQLAALYDGDASKGLRVADQILAMTPEHPDTLAYRGVFVQKIQQQRKTKLERQAVVAAGGEPKKEKEPEAEADAAPEDPAAKKKREEEEKKKKEEEEKRKLIELDEDELDAVLKESPEEIVKNALTLSQFKSSHCWHALGVIHKKENNRGEAYKCFTQCIKLDGKPMHYIRDASNEAVQRREWEQFLIVRQKALNENSPGIRSHWSMYATAHQMCGNYQMASALYDAMAAIMPTGDNQIEVDQCQFHRVEIAMLGGDPRRAVSILNKEKPFDLTTKNLLAAKAYTMIGDAPSKKKAEDAWKYLISVGQHQRDALFAIAALHGIAVDPMAHGPKTPARLVPKESAEFVALLDQIAAEYPKCEAAQRLVLDYIPVAELAPRVQQYCKRFVAKAIPSVVSVLKSLYSSKPRVAVVEEVFLQWDKDLAAGNGAFFSKDGSAEVNPLWQLTVFQFLTSHFVRTEAFAKAHEYADKALAHTPTMPEVHLDKAKVLHREGKLLDAALATDDGRKLELGDKYLNSKCAKYMLRAGEIETAEATLAMFHKAGQPKEATYLFMWDNQCDWYAFELGDAYLKKKNDIVSALQSFLQFHRKREDDREELEDFHNYTFRRGNARTWVDVIRTIDNYRSTKMYLKNAAKIVECYLRVADEGEEAIKARHVPRAAVPWEQFDNVDERARFMKLEKDLRFEVDISSPLEKATQYVQDLVKHDGKSTSAQTLAFELYIRKEKPLLAAKAAKALEALGAPLPAEKADKLKALFAAHAAPAPLKAVFADMQ